MSEPTDAGIVRILLDWAWAGVLGLAGLLYKDNRSHLNELRVQLHAFQEKAIMREEFTRHEEREERDRGERRGAEEQLFRKFDDLKDDMNNKFDALKDLLLEKLK